jgi:hypothetical protein
VLRFLSSLPAQSYSPFFNGFLENDEPIEPTHDGVSEDEKERRSQQDVNREAPRKLAQAPEPLVKDEIAAEHERDHLADEAAKLEPLGPQRAALELAAELCAND